MKPSWWLLWYAHLQWVMVEALVAARSKGSLFLQACLCSKPVFAFLLLHKKWLKTLMTCLTLLAVTYEAAWTKQQKLDQDTHTELDAHIFCVIVQLDTHTNKVHTNSHIHTTTHTYTHIPTHGTLGMQ